MGIMGCMEFSCMGYPYLILGFSMINHPAIGVTLGTCNLHFSYGHIVQNDSTPYPVGIKCIHSALEVKNWKYESVCVFKKVCICVYIYIYKINVYIYIYIYSL